MDGAVGCSCPVLSPNLTWVLVECSRLLLPCGMCWEGAVLCKLLHPRLRASWGLLWVLARRENLLIMGMLGHGQSPAVSALWSSKVPRLFFQTFIFTDGEDEELKKQARESLCVRGLSARCLGLCWSPAQHPQPGECQKKKPTKVEMLQCRHGVLWGRGAGSRSPGLGSAQPILPMQMTPFQAGKQFPLSWASK